LYGPHSVMNFTEHVRQVLWSARDHALKTRAEAVATEHVLFAMLAQSDGVAITVLRALGAVDFDQLRDALTRAGGGDLPDVAPRRPLAVVRGPELPYTWRAKRVLEFAMEEARQLSHSYIGTEHLLLGLLREKKGAAAQVLAEAGVTTDGARAQVLRVLQDGLPEPVPGPPPLAVVPSDVTPIDAIAARAEHAILGGYTPRARRVLAASMIEAARLGADEVQTEHLLLGLLTERDGVAATILARLAFDGERARAAFDFSPTDMRRAAAANLPFSDAVRRTLHFAREASMDGQARVGTDGLLLGLLTDGEGLGWQLLAAGGVTLHAARAEREKLTG
jgi:ATP-dependent Clp protease ATP-binding subunit ClpA